jgi:hypothetical protein
MKFQPKRSPARGRGFHFGLWPLRSRTSPRRVRFSFGLSTKSEDLARFFWSKTSKIAWLLRHIERLRYIHNQDSMSRIIYRRLSTSNSVRYDRFRSELQIISSIILSEEILIVPPKRRRSPLSRFCLATTTLAGVLRFECHFGRPLPANLRHSTVGINLTQYIVFANETFACHGG